MVPRQATGSIDSHPWKDGRTISWWLRVRFKGQRYRVDLGTNHEGWNEERAQVRLDEVMAEVERGTWTPPVDEVQDEAPDNETLHATASRFWNRKRKEGLEEKTEVDYEWRLKRLLAYDPHVETSAIDVRWVDGLREWLLRQPSERGGTLSSRSVNMVLAFLAQALDDAVEYGLLPANPARGSRRRVREKKKRKRFLEPDMVVDLLDAAGEWEEELRDKKGQPHQCFGRRAMLAALILAGPRLEEQAAARLSDLDIHTEVLRVDRSKTEAGERDIDLTAYLLSELRPHLAELPKIIGRETKPDDQLFPTRNGNQRVSSSVRRTLAGAVERANKKRGKRNKLLIPEELTPHDLRRTYACLCFWAGRQLPYVQAQIGHKDGRMTLEAYAYATKRERVNRKLVWELMRFSEEDDHPVEIGEPGAGAGVERKRPAGAGRCAERGVVGDWPR